MEPRIRVCHDLFQKSAGRKGHVTQGTEPVFLMEQELFFKAIDDRRGDEVFFADAAHGQMSVKVVAQDQQDHGKGVRQIGNDEIRQECMGLSTGALHTRDSQAEHLRLPIREDKKVSFIASPFAAGSFCTAGRADQKKQRVLIQTLPVKVSDM